MRPISGSGSSATPRPTEAIATRKSQCALWAAMAGCMPASAKAWRSRRVMAKSSVGTSSRESRRAVRGRDVLPAQAASGGPMTQIGWLPKAAARPWSGATGRTVAPTSSSPSATRCSTAWPVPSRSVRWMFGWRSRKRLTTGVNSRLIMGGMPTSSAAAQVRRFTDFLGQLAHGLQHLQAALVHHAAGVRGAGRMSVADQQLRASFLFQLPDHLADGGLRDEQGACRLREAGVPDRLDKVAQRAHPWSHPVRIGAEFQLMKKRLE